MTEADFKRASVDDIQVLLRNKLILVTNTPNTAALNFEDGLSALTSLSAVIDIQGESSFFLRYNGYFSHELLNY